MSEIDVTKCENYKLGFSGYICTDPNLRNDCSLNNNCKFKQLHRYKQAVEDIKEIATNNIEYKMYSDDYLPVGKTIIFEKIIQKCEEMNK